MRNEQWQGLDDPALERLLIERWLLRGLMLAIILVAAVIATIVAARGLASLTDQITLGVLLALALTAAGVALSMRQHDLRIHRELRRRHLEEGRRP